MCPLPDEVPVLPPWPGKRAVTLDPDLANQSSLQFQIMTTSL